MNENELSTESIAAVDESWNDSDFSETVENSQPAAETEPETDNTPAEGSPEVDQPSEDAEAQPSEQDEQPSETEDQGADQRFELKHKDERRQVTLEEMRTLAQKGMDYDTVRSERDELREYKAFLQELAGSKSIEDLIDEARAAMLVQQQGLDADIALQRVKLEREQKAFAAQKQRDTEAKNAEQQKTQAAQQAEAAKNQWRQDCFLAFSKEFPGVKPTEIPKDVWTAFQNGETLVSAYRGHKLRELEQQMQAKQTAEDAAQRSTGSQKTAGGEQISDIDRIWDEMLKG